MRRRRYDDYPDEPHVHDDYADRHPDDRPVSGEVYEEEAGRPWYAFDFAGRINMLIFTALFAVLALLLTRFLLLAFDANQNNGFVQFIMDVSYPFMRPFRDVFANRTWDEGVIELGTLLAMGVWTVVAALLAMMVAALLPHGHEGPTTRTGRRITHHG